MDDELMEAGDEVKEEMEQPAETTGFRGFLEQEREALKEKLLELAQGASEDISEFISEIMVDVVIAAQKGRTDLIASMEGQMRVLAEKHRIQVARAAWSTVIGLFTKAAEAVAAALTKGGAA
jgi:flagellar hook-basal body complex protein FliE